MNTADIPLFNPRKFPLPGDLVLIPQFWDRDYYEELKKKARQTYDMLVTQMLLFKDFSLIVGFLGYPHILTTLEFIKDVREKEIYFLGTAGSLNEQIDRPMPLEVDRVYPSPPITQFAKEESFTLKSLESKGLRKASGVTVDIPQRETVSWYKDQVARGIDFVEMELFPLCAYLGKPFYAVVVTSDILREQGIEVFPNKKMRKEFVTSYEYIVRHIHEKKGHPD